MENTQEKPVSINVAPASVKCENYIHQLLPENIAYCCSHPVWGWLVEATYCQNASGL